MMDELQFSEPTPAQEIRADLKRQWEVKQKELLREQALYEDQLLLATIKSTFMNPKYDL